MNVPDVAVLIPVLDRPHRVEPLVASLLATVPNARPVFVCSPSDTTEIEAVKAQHVEPMVVEWDPVSGDYARKINHAFRNTSEEWVLLAADDVLFQPDWFDAALRVYSARRPCVIGTNDLGNPRVTSGQHSVYTLVHRAYGECGTIDDPSCLLHEGYWHSFVDDEFIGTAMHRETYWHCQDSIIEHMHPHWGKGQMDKTYERGLLRFNDDRVLNRNRMHLWSGSWRQAQRKVVAR